MNALRSLSITPLGRSVAAGAVFLLLLGAVLGYTALTTIAAVTGVVLLATALRTIRVPAIVVERVVDRTRVQRGVPVHGLVSVRNATSSTSSACVATEPVSDGAVRVDGVEVLIPSLRPGQSIAVPYDVPTARRGRLRVGPLSLDRRDVFDFWRATRVVGASLEVVVEPFVHVIDPRPAGRERHLDGPTSDTAPRGTLTFHSLREYVHGDDIRHVHWKSSAKTGTLMVREHVDTSLPSTVIVLDTRPDRYTPAAFEEAVDVVASMVAASDRHGFPIRLVTTDGTTLTVRAGQRAEELRSFLASVDMSADGDLDGAAAQVLASRDRDAIIVISGDVDDGDLACVTMMTRRFDTAGLVTVRTRGDQGDVEGAQQWTGGLHFDGPTAAAALSRWHRPAGRGAAA